MTHATSFGSAAADYESGRPGYPADAVAWLLPSAPATVVDVGAGTGKLTRSLVGLARTVIAVDPDEEMLAVLSRSVPEARAIQGSAEVIPLEDASADAVVLGQAWHWVDPAAASVEVARVLRPGGTLGLLWNIRDAREPWVARLGEAMRGSAAEQLLAGPGPQVSAPFGPLEHRTWQWRRPVTADAVRAMARSRSHYIVGEASYRAQVDSDVDAALADAPREGGLRLPYVTHAYRAHRP